MLRCPYRGEAEPLRVDGETDRVVVGAGPVGLAGPSLRAEESKAKSHTGEPIATRSDIGQALRRARPKRIPGRAAAFDQWFTGCSWAGPRSKCRTRRSDFVGRVGAGHACHDEEQTMPQYMLSIHTVA